jgi:ABC-2 type transport system ATP-binding protein
MSTVLEINDLHKEYGKVTALNHLSLRVEKGQVFGLLGPNGSGKTTTLGIILDVIRPTSGSFKWFGQAPDHQQRKRIGAILEKPNFYPTFSAFRNLQLVCKIKQVGEERIAPVLEQVGLSERQHDSFKTYSLGMKQRLAIASALLADPEVLILDEPTNGLDPQGIAEIRQLITDIAQEGKTIILASHLLDEVQKVCSRFAVLQKGKLIHAGDVETGFGEEVIIELGSEQLNELKIALESFPGLINSRMDKDGITITCVAGTEAIQLNKFLSERGLFLSHLTVKKKNLEQQFLEILSENG